MHLRRVYPFEYNLIRILILINLWILGCKLYRNPFKSIRVIIRLLHKYSKTIGAKKIVRGFKLNGTYRWDMFSPPWPTKAFNKFCSSHLLDIEPVHGENKSLKRIIVAITKICPLQCEHCCESATLYNKDFLSCKELIDKIEPFVQNSLGQIIYSGGEPISRFNDLLSLISHFNKRSDQWIYTSGFGLTQEKAFQLKKAGLNGAAISLDNHSEEEHNAFRGNGKSFEWVINAIKNLQAADIFVAINVCPTKKYIDSGGLVKLIDFAKEMHVSMINFLEPRAVGNYEDKDVELNLNQKNYLLNLSHQFNFERKYFLYPTIFYPASFKNADRCGGGHNYIFMDYDGKLYPCPYCKTQISAPSEKELCEAV